jgi:ABC-type glycerol-3-phosphate transport system substrate-binding protein
VIRVKRAEGPGGIFETLQAGSLVAPAAMPDLALVQHGELAKMAAAKLIQAVDMRALAVDDLFSASTMLGQMQNAQYGVPYVLETQHIAYRSAGIPAPPLTLDDLLALRLPYLFPARAVKGLNATFLAQYTAAGGRVTDATGVATLDRAPLLEVLRYYEKSIQAETVTPSLLDYSSATQYWSQFMMGKAALVQVDSTTFLAQRAGGMPNTGPSAVGVSPLPLPAENLLTMIDGWVWVITTTDVDRRARALEVIAWFMNPDRQGALARSLGVLPSRRAALRTWAGDSYVSFVEPLLERNPAPLPDSVNAAIATALQDAFENVLYHRKSSEVAADEALAKIPKTQ